MTAAVETPALPPPPPPTRWTVQQEAVFEAVRQGRDHVLCEAVAGSGKTTTAVVASGFAPEKRVGFVAFNRHIADELRGRLAGAARACTLHSLGYAALRRTWPASEKDDLKAVRLLAKLPCGPATTYVRKEQPAANATGKAILELARACKLTLSPPQAEVLDDLVDLMGIDLPGRLTAQDLAGDVAALLDAMREDVRRHDFDDMLWLPVQHRLAVERFDFLFIDEMQDLSALQRTLALMAAAGRVLGLGDSRQSINLFAGADPKSVGELAFALSRGRQLALRPLTTTFRCPVSHVELARQIVPHIEAVAGAADGLVEVLDTEKRLVELAASGDLILARRNAPLVSTTLKLLALGKPAAMIGRDLGRGLLDLIDQLPHADLAALVVGLEDWRAAQVDRLERKGASDAAIQAVQDRAACVRELASLLKTPAELVAFVRDKLGSDESVDRSKVISLSSVHRAKGLEARRVFLIDTGSLPMILPCRACKGSGQGPLALHPCPKCRGRGCRQSAAMIEQEWNLLYVALTRSKSEMYFVGGPPAGLTW